MNTNSSCEPLILLRVGSDKYSYGIGYPICTIKDDEFITKKFVGDMDDYFYEVTVTDKIQRRLLK